MKGFSSLLFLSLFSLAGCGANHEFKAAIKLEKKKQYYKAWEKYQEFAANHPKHEKAPEALFRAGWVAHKNFQDCYIAQTFYEEVLLRYPQSDPWARAAALQSRSCPDYFPLIGGAQWIEVDSDTNGKNARIEIVEVPLKGQRKNLPSESGCLERTYFAGMKKFETTEYCYLKEQSEVLEFKKEAENIKKTVLKWPLEVGAKWTTRSSGQIFHYEIVSLDKDIAVAAGNFKHCLSVQSYIEGNPGAKIEYYAPQVGRVLTTSSTKQGEKRITELMSFKIPEMADFST